MVPSRSAVTSRMDVDLTTPDGVGTTIPIVVSNMTAVSGKRMAETVARRGAVAVLPQDIPVEAIEETVAAVKAADPVYETPIVVEPGAPVAQVLSVMGKRAHRAAVVVDDQHRPVGLVTEADCVEVDRFAQVGEVMSELGPTVKAGAAVRDAFDLLDGEHLELAVVVDGETLRGVVTRKGLLRSAIYTPALDTHGRLRVGAAVGINGDVRARAAAIL